MKNDFVETAQESESALKILDSLLKDSGQKKINENQIVIILDALASADDGEVVARFPAVLAICARRGLSLNSQALYSQKLEPPGNLGKIAASLKLKYGNLISAGAFQLSSGMLVSIEDLEESLTRFLGSQPRYQAPEKQVPPGSSITLDIYLDRLFSPKQKELILKKRDGVAFTKTEREYYSRTVRKKLEAIASDEVNEIAKSLIIKTGNQWKSSLQSHPRG